VRTEKEGEKRKGRKMGKFAAPLLGEIDAPDE